MVKTTNRYHSVTLRICNQLIVLTLLFFPAYLKAQTPQVPVAQLLSPPEISAQFSPADANGKVLRSRTASVRLDLLSRLSTRGADIISFNLFDDVALECVFTRRIKRSSTSYSWFGEILGYHGGTFSLAVEKNTMVANVSLPGEVMYQIRHLADGLHEVREISPENIPGCSGGIRIPEQARKSAASNDQIATTDDQVGALDASCGADILVVYTPVARTAAGGTTAMQALVNLAVDAANIAYENSEINMRLRLVHQAEISYTESGSKGIDLERLTYNDSYMESIFGLRNTYGADLVCLLVHYTSGCGTAWLWDDLGDDFTDWAFSVVVWDCAAGYYSLAHEAGHNMGCAHATPESVQGEGLYNYSMGWRFGIAPNQYRTVMAYSPGTRIQHFSNPDINYDGYPTGVPVAYSNRAHNARSINNASSSIVNWRSHTVAYTPPVAQNDNAATQPGIPVEITLDATDDGCPGSMDFIVLSLPSYGTLTDPGSDDITAGELPYTITGGQNQLTYTPTVSCYTGPDTFTFKANDGGSAPTGGDSNIATCTIEISTYTSTTIGSGTSTWDYPMFTYWHDSRTQVIYTSAEIGSATTISAMSLYVTTLPGQSLSNWTIRIKHTALSSYATASFETAGWTTVFQDDVTVSSTGWNMFAFTTPFVYNGSSNLMVDFSHNNSSYTTQGYCRRWTPGGVRSAFAYSDSDHSDPLNWSGTTSPDVYGHIYVPQLQFSQSVDLSPPVGDFEPDCVVGWKDLAFLCTQWLNTSCNSGNDYCGGADFEPDNDVDFRDFAIFAENFGQGM